MSRQGSRPMSSQQAAIELVMNSLPFYEGVDFGYVCVQKKHTQTITLHNPAPVSLQNEVRFQFQIAQSDFTVSPMQGTIGPKQKQEITITFQSDQAKVIIGSLICEFFQGSHSQHRVLKMSAMSKYPFIKLNQDKIEFEQLLVGKVARQTVTLKNSSYVACNIRVEEKHDDDKENSFSLNLKQATLKPLGEAKIEVSYSPSVVGQISCQYYRIISDGGNECTLSCRGEAEGYDVALSTKSVSFGECAVGTSVSRLINVCNNNDVPCTFQFQTDKNNMFSLSCTEGIVKPYSFHRVIISFTPPTTGNFYERIFCLVRHHTALYIDVMGTCYDILTKPIPLQQRHVDAFRHKVIMGTHNKLAPQKQTEDFYSDTYGSGKVDFMREADVDLELEIPIDDPSQVVLHKEMLLSVTAPERNVRLSVDQVDFGFTERGRISGARSVSLNNKFVFPIQVNWHLMDVVNKNTNKIIKNPFKMVPDTGVIAPGESMNFNTNFGPYEPDQYFFQQAQAFVTLLNGNENKVKKPLNAGKENATANLGKTKALMSMKSTRFQDFSGEMLDPPIVMNLRLSGHSFAPGSQPFIPMVKLSSKEITFLPCNPGESVFRSILIQNTSDTPVLYRAMQDSTATFKSYPSLGLIRGKGFALICLEFSPKSVRNYSFSAQFLFNNSTSNIQQVQLQGTCYGPSITLPKDSLFFSPTYIGVSTHQAFSVKNDSKIPVFYEWRVPNKYKSEIIFTPNNAMLLPSEESQITATFTPLKKKDYSITVPICAQNSFDEAKNFVGFYNPGSGAAITNGQGESVTGAYGGITTVIKDLFIIGAGNDGAIKISPQTLDFSTITVGFTKTLQVVVANESNCTLFINLKIVPAEGQNSNGEDLEGIMKRCFRFDSSKGLVNAKSKKKLNLTFKPDQRYDFSTQLVCEAREYMNKDLQKEVKLKTQRGFFNPPGTIQKCAINVKCMGDYPQIRVTDVRNDNVSIASLWERFQLTAMNKELLKPLTKTEFTYNNSDKANMSAEEMANSLTRFHWDFGKIATKRGSNPRKITITLKNIGGVPAHWCFKFPNDSDIELEPWVDVGEPSPEQAFEKTVLDHNIFRIEPRNGLLEPGEQRDLVVFYYPQPKLIMKHFLNVFFQIQNGKPLMIQLQGETLARRACLQLIKDVYHMPAIPIGMDLPITYPIEIKNLGITKLKYQMDLSALESLNASNYDYRIFDVQNPNDELKSNQTKHIFVLFKPLEARTYNLDLPIKIEDIEGVQKEPVWLRLKGTGFEPNQKMPKEIQFYEDLPLCRANLDDHGAMAAFSLEQIDFGEVEAEKPVNRFVILYNLHEDQKCNFEFKKTELTCGDILKLEPITGELKPGAHVNIKMTINSSRFPAHFEGEICCAIDWNDRGDVGERSETRSHYTQTAIADSSEYLFLRIKKRAKIDKILMGADSRESENLIENIMHEAIHDILEDDEFDQLLDTMKKNPMPQLYSNDINDAPAPSKDFLKPQKGDNQSMESDEESEQDQVAEYEAITPGYENKLKSVTPVEDSDIFRKRMFLNKPFTELMEFMLEDTLFNLMEEATYEEFDITQPPKIYIRKN